MFSIVYNVVISGFAVKGSFVSQLIVGIVYFLSPLFLPVLPNVQNITWSLVSCGLLFLSWTFLSRFTDNIDKSHSNRIKRGLRYRRNNYLSLVFSVAILVLAIMFFRGVFPYYPITVMSNSMSGTFERGAIVIVRRMPQEQVFFEVEQGQVIHFNYGNASYLHRVVDFRYTHDRQRLYITQGDANPTVDSTPVQQQDILGISKSFFPHIGYPKVVFHRIFNRR